MFTKIENAEVLVQISGGYKVLPVFKRNSTGNLFAKNGQTYIALLVSNVTSNSKIMWREINIDVEFSQGNMVHAKES
jgi:hypothetical protein